MARTHFSRAAGLVPGGLSDNNPVAGPSSVAQWWALRDPRYPYNNGSATGPNAFLSGGDFCVADMIPPTLAAAGIGGCCHRY